ncbi:hypothetical protein BG011_001314 [Mortierella polycephala]|uniref:Uncharacterized protein n=1 Tax=Mortierella polycephala TaxID=41804 RepID=A0A9P6Q9Z5_9FUNG|nr:hypothetical protein BG011_001314 [Mortierella polycephala]
MSGIVNARMDNARSFFGEDLVEKIKRSCLRSNMHVPTTKLSTIFEPLQSAFKTGGLPQLLDQADISIGKEAYGRFAGETSNALKKKVLDAIRHLCVMKSNKDMSEAELVALWGYVFGTLLGRPLSMRSGELTSKATRWQQLLMKIEYSIDMGTAAYGRKLNIQCHADRLEINNSEFKAHSIARQQVDIQYRKNLRIFERSDKDALGGFGGAGTRCPWVHWN